MILSTLRMRGSTLSGANTQRRDGVEPRGQMLSHILGYRENDRLTLRELFIKEVPADGDTPACDDTTVLDHLREVARFKVIGVFRVVDMSSSRSWPSGRTVKTDHYLPDMDGSLDQLVHFIARRMKGTHDFVRPNDLPVKYRVLTKHWRDSVRAQARYLLLEDVVKELVSKETQLWYHPGHQWWQASQSLMDEYDPLLRRVRNLPPPRHWNKDDKRPFHGHPKNHRRRGPLGTVPGGKKR